MRAFSKDSVLIVEGGGKGRLSRIRIIGDEGESRRSRKDTQEDMVFATPLCEISANFITAKGRGFTNLALISHANRKDRPDASFAGAQKGVAKLPVPVYAIDDQTAIKVTDDTVDVISEGHWKLFTSSSPEAVVSRSLA